MLTQIQQLFQWLEKESSLTQMWKLLLRVFAIGIPLALLLKSIELWRAIGGASMPVRMTLGMVVLQLGLIGVALWSLGVLWARSNSPLADAPGKRFPLLLLAIPGCRAVGEVVAGSMVIMGVFGALATWVSGAGTRMLGLPIPGGMGGGTFTSGMSTMLFGLLGAFVVILVSYRMAEWVGLALSVERSVRKTAESTGEVPAHRPVTAASHPETKPPAP